MKGNTTDVNQSHVREQSQRDKEKNTYGHSIDGKGIQKMLKYYL